MTIINMLLIALIVVFVVDLSGFVDNIKKAVWRKWIKVGDYHKLQFKPFTCSLCLTWWCCFFYLILINQLTLPLVALSALFSFLTPVMGDILIWLKDLLTTVINLLYKLIR